MKWARSILLAARSCRGEVLAVPGANKLHRVSRRFNSVYAWGNASDGRLGLGTRVDEESHTVGFAVYHPRKLDKFSDADVVKVECGSAHTLFLTADGEVYTCGRGTQGQLGHGDFEDCYVPRRLECLSGKCTDIAAGYLHSMALTEQGDIYTFGQARNGQLGIGETEENCFKPAKLPAFVGSDDRVVSVHAGDYFSVAFTENGKVYTFGLADNGRLGCPDACRPGSPKLERSEESFKIRLTPPNVQSRVRGSPSRVESLGAMGTVFCGQIATVAVSRYGHVYGWGCGENYTFGNGSDCDLNTPEELEFLSNLCLKKLSTSSTHSIALNSDGRLIVWGTNESGCLGYGGNASGYPIVIEHTSTETFLDVCAGFRFSVAVRSDGAVYSWGNGDSGALGVGLGIDYWTPKPVRQFNDESDAQFSASEFRASKVACGFNHVIAIT